VAARLAGEAGHRPEERGARRAHGPRDEKHTQVIGARCGPRARGLGPGFPHSAFPQRSEEAAERKKSADETGEGGRGG